MDKREKVALFVKVWYMKEVQTYADFRKHHPECKASSKFVEGDEKTYPKGFQNGSLSQKAKRYILARDAEGRTSDDPKWKPAHPSLARRNAAGEWEFKKLKSGNGGSGGQPIKLFKSDFEGVDIDDNW